MQGRVLRRFGKSSGDGLHSGGIITRLKLRAGGIRGSGGCEDQ